MLEQTAYQKEYGQDGSNTPIAGGTASDDLPQEEPGQGIEQQNLQIDTHGRMLGEEHQEQDNAHHTDYGHQQGVPPSVGALLAQLEKVQGDAYEQKDDRTGKG